jgi:hypothetical protein
VRADNISCRHLILISPQVATMPLPIQRYDDPFLPFGKAIIAATRDIAFGYLFDFAAYLALGAAGAIALERTLAYVMAPNDAISVVHAPFSSAAFAIAMSDRAFYADAVTITTHDIAASFTQAGVIPLVVESGERTDFHINAGLTRCELAGVALEIQRENITYAGSLDDFAEQARSALLRLCEA